MRDALVSSGEKEQRLQAWLSEYGNAILRMFFIYLADRELAQGALHDTFLKSWHRMDSFLRAQRQFGPKLESAHRHQHLQGLPPRRPV